MQRMAVAWIRWLVIGSAVVGSGAGQEGEAMSRAKFNPLLPLLSARFQPQLLVTRRAATVLYRVRLVASAFAVLTLLWIPVDAFMLDSATSVPVAIARLVTGAAFLTLALLTRRGGRPLPAPVAVLGLILIPCLFFVFAATQWSEATLAQAGYGLRGIYASVPFVTAAGLGLFPLTALEALAASLPIFLAAAAVAALGVPALTPMDTLGSLWLLILVTGVAGLAGMAQVSLMSELLHQMTHDPLTGAYRRATGEELLGIQMSLARRTRIPLAILFIDLDRFKSVNDQYGHEAGDQVLQAAARAVRAQMRGGDILIRWGGEEFVAVLPDMRCEDADRFLERMRAQGLALQPDGTPVTASVGVSERLADGVSDCAKLVEIADQRMYQAKQRGRDRWISCADAAAGSVPAAESG